MNDYQKLAEFFSHINEEMAVESEKQKGVLEAYEKLKESCKSKIDSMLTQWEEDIESGRIKDETIIENIKRLRAQYNATFKN